MRKHIVAVCIVLNTAACTQPGLQQIKGSPFAPAVDVGGRAEDPIIVGNRLMASQQFALALESFQLAASNIGQTGGLLGAMGSAKLGLGQLGQAEDMLRRAVHKDPQWPELWNNLGVVLAERGKIPEAYLVFKKAYALDNGDSDTIRDNLTRALAALDEMTYGEPQQYQSEFALARIDRSVYALRN